MQQIFAILTSVVDIGNKTEDLCGARGWVGTSYDVESRVPLATPYVADFRDKRIDTNKKARALVLLSERSSIVDWHIKQLSQQNDTHDSFVVVFGALEIQLGESGDRYSVTIVELGDIVKPMNGVNRRTE